MITINGRYAENMKDVYEQWLSIQDYDRKSHNVLAYRKRADLIDIFTGYNIVTNSGDLYYAQAAAGDSLDEDYASANNRCELQNPGSADTPAKSDTYSSMTTPIVASRTTIEATYPQTADPDGDNTGSGVDIITWEYNWTTGDFDTDAQNDITGGTIHNSAGSPMAADDVLTHWNFSSSFEKLDTDTLKVFVNHEFRGV